MESERIMRTSIFGGFRREDVLTYVEELQSQIEALKNDVSEKENSINELNDKVVDLTRECSEISLLKSELEEKDTAIEALNNENTELKEQVESLTAVSAEYENAKKTIEENNLNIKAAEARLGAAFIDARKYSDEIVAAANDKAHETAKSISTDIQKQAGEISRLSSEVDRISSTFTKSIDELHQNIAILAQRMAAAAKNLNIRQDAVFEPDFSIEIKKDSKQSHTIETNDGSGLTYIQYPPHTEFNEDLNIQPDGSFNVNEG